MRQTWAILLDAYRELNARKLFWLTMILSALVVMAFGLVGINEKGLKLVVWDVESPVVNTKLFTPGEFYKMVYVGFGIQFWLGWVATILGLVSTASMIPDFVSGGSIELTLSKPIGRLRLFLTKYLGGLIFTAAQVFVFSLASFLVIGIRGGAWEPGLFWAVPIIVLLFSYLYAVSALVGLVTRSTIAAVLLTLLVWFLSFGVHSTEQVMLGWRVQRELETASGEKRLATQQDELKNLEASAKPAGTGEAGEEHAESKSSRDLERKREQIVKTERDLAEVRASTENAGKWHMMAFAVKTALPKTSETVDLLRRTLVKSAALKVSEEHDAPDVLPFGRPKFPVTLKSFQERVMEVQNTRSVWWIIGTSLGFEAVVLGIAALIFCRRDF